MRRIGVFLIGCVATNAFAYFCPANFNSVAVGATLEEVKTACGAPVSEKSYPMPSDTMVGTWEYVKSTPGTSFTTSLKFTAQDNKIANIEITKSREEIFQICQAMQVGARSDGSFQVWCSHPGPYTVNNTTLCGGVVRIGDNVQLLEYLCGKPIRVVHERSDDPSKMVTEYVLTGDIPATFVFVNGQLVGKK